MASVLEDDCWREGDGLSICGRAAVMNRTGLIEFVQGLLGREELGARITLYQRTEKRAASPRIRETLRNDKARKPGPAGTSILFYSLRSRLQEIGTQTGNYINNKDDKRHCAADVGCTA